MVSAFFSGTRIVLRGVLKLLDGLAQALGEGRQLGAAEEEEEDDQDDHQFRATEAEDTGEGQERKDMAVS